MDDKTFASALPPRDPSIEMEELKESLQAQRDEAIRERDEAQRSLATRLLGAMERERGQLRGELHETELQRDEDRLRVELKEEEDPFVELERKKKTPVVFWFWFIALFLASLVVMYLAAVWVSELRRDLDNASQPIEIILPAAPEAPAEPAQAEEALGEDY